VIAGVHHIGIVVTDMDAAARVLEELLGLERTQRLSLPRGVTSAFYRCGAASIELIEIGDPDLRARRLGPDGAQVRIEHVALAVNDLAHTVATLAAGGARFTNGAGQDGETHEPLETGGLRTLFTIPDSTAGLALQLVQPLDSA
jgi:catechol 2,3-dioxygenase-like lactoylglutathione lyase family enzyme